MRNELDNFLLCFVSMNWNFKKCFETQTRRLQMYKKKQHLTGYKIPNNIFS